MTSIRLPPNPWTSTDGRDGACVARGEADRQTLDGPYPKGTGTSRARLERLFISHYCDHCPIKKFCGEYGRDEEFGIWGGRTESERRQDRKMLAMLRTL